LPYVQSNNLKLYDQVTQFRFVDIQKTEMQKELQNKINLKKE